MGVMMAPVEGIRKIWAKTGWKPDEVDLYEINEAFAVQSVAVIKELGIDPARVNPNGGAIALGHPLGCTGAKLTASIVRELERRVKVVGLEPGEERP